MKSSEDRSRIEPRRWACRKGNSSTNISLLSLALFDTLFAKAGAMSESDCDSSSDDCFDQNVQAARGGVVRHEHDIVVSMADEQYMQIITPEIERLVGMRQRGQKPDVKERAEGVMRMLREIIQKSGGCYLQMKKKPSRFEKIDEAQAKEKIRVDLNTESRRMFNKRKADARASQTNSREVKKPKSDETPKTKHGSDLKCKDSPATAKVFKLDEGWSVRPRRATQQLRDDLPFKEILESTPNPIGKDVAGFAINQSFKLKGLTTEDDKLDCVGQLIAKELLENTKDRRWAVKHCEVHGKWEFVTFEDCNNVNSQMEAALAGMTEGHAFVGYKKLAEYVLQNGLLEKLIKDSSKVKEMMKKLRITKPTASIVVTGRAVTSVSKPSMKEMQDFSDDSVDRIHACNISKEVVDDSAADSVASKVSSKVSFLGTVSTGHTIMGMAILRLQQLQKMDDYISKQVSSATRESNFESVSFYSNLRSWLASKSADPSFIENFDESEIKDTINEFENVAKKLAIAKERNDAIGISLNKNMIAYLINSLL